MADCHLTPHPVPLSVPAVRNPGEYNLPFPNFKKQWRHFWSLVTRLTEYTKSCVCRPLHLQKATGPQTPGSSGAPASTGPGLLTLGSVGFEVPVTHLVFMAFGSSGFVVSKSRKGHARRVSAVAGRCVGRTWSGVLAPGV